MATQTLDRVPVTEQTVQENASQDEADDLATAFRAGDERALERIYREHGKLIYSYCVRSVGDSRAADATQEVFLAAWRSRDRYRPESGSLAGWLMGIARFKVIDMYRIERRNPLAPERAQDVDVGAESSELAGMAQRMLLADALAQLPERSQQMVRRAFLHDQTHAQIADECGVPLGTVKSDIRRGLDRLRRHLEGFDDAPRT